MDIDLLISAISEVIGEKNDFVPLHSPYFSGNEWTYVKECIDSGWVSSVGSYVDKFENRLAEYTGSNYAVAVVNGTAALHVCLILADIKPNDEVLLPALTFVATANAVHYCGAIPHFVDCSEDTLGMDPEKLDDYLKQITYIESGVCYNKLTKRRIKAVVPMHTFGHPVRICKLKEVSKKYKLEMIEDAAESLGSFYNGSHTGNWGKTAALSFNGNKIITTGGGGAIITNDSETAKLAKHITTTAKVPHKWSFYHDIIGYNYRLPNINAALGCAQLEQLPSFLQKKRNLASYYQRALAHVQGVRFFVEPIDSSSNYWLNTIILDDRYAGFRDQILQKTNELGIGTRPSWTLLHRLPPYEHCPKMDLSVAERLEKTIINIPSGVEVGG